VPPSTDVTLRDRQCNGTRVPQSAHWAGKGLRSGQLAHLPLLYLAAEWFAEFVGPSLDGPVVGHALDRSLRPTQLDLHFGGFAAKPVQAFFEPLRPVEIRLHR